MKVLVLDNYDSFTYNLVHYLEAFDAEVDVFRNDEITLEQVGQYDNIVLSPGPGLPEDAGILLGVIEKYSSTKRILGVCLGLQAIGLCFGEELYNLDEVYHGVSSKVNKVAEHYLLNNIPQQFEVGRYHSWAIKHASDMELEIMAVDENGVVMAAHHPEYDVCGVQFHPESIMTPHGKQMIKNWLNNGQ